MARDFKGGEKHRDDLFAETPPLEAKRLLLSRAITKRVDGRRRKILVIDARKAHLNSKCEEDVYIELQEECGAAPGISGKSTTGRMVSDQPPQLGRSSILGS